MTEQADTPDDARSLDELIARGELDAAASVLDELQAHDVAEELTRLHGPRRAIAFRLLPKDDAFAAFEELDANVQQALLDALHSTDAIGLVEELDPDDRVQLFDELPATVVRQLLAQLSPSERERTSTLMGYEPGTVGRAMSPAVVRLVAGSTIVDALAQVRRAGPRAETLDVLPVTDDERVLQGVLPLSRLVLSEPHELVEDRMLDTWPSVSVYETEEDAARLMQRADLQALPAVDAEGRLVGILTFDDAMEILELADTEDYVRSGGSEPLGRHYLTASIPLLARRRATWLLLLIVASSLTVQVLRGFEGTLEEAVTLALFIPLLIGTGGNAGAQAATTVVRAMAVGEVRRADLPRVVAREAATGVLLGLVLGIVAFAPVAWLFGASFGAVVAVTLVLICAWASTVGAAMPMLAERFGIDPSLVSAPLVTTLVDATGLVTYFLVARALLGL